MKGPRMRNIAISVFILITVIFQNSGSALAAQTTGRMVGLNVLRGFVIGAGLGTSGGLIIYGMKGNKDPFNSFVYASAFGAIIGAGLGGGVGIFETSTGKKVGPIIGENAFGGLLLGAGIGGLGASFSYRRTRRGADYTTGVGVGGLTGAVVGVGLSFYEAFRMGKDYQMKVGPVVGSDVTGGVLIGTALGLSAGLIPYGSGGNMQPFNTLLLPMAYGALIGSGAGLILGLYEVSIERPLGPIIAENTFGGILIGVGVGAVGASISFIKSRKGSDYTSGTGVGAITGAASGLGLAFYEAYKMGKPGYTQEISQKKSEKPFSFAFTITPPIGPNNGFTIGIICLH